MELDGNMLNANSSGIRKLLFSTEHLQSIQHRAPYMFGPVEKRPPQHRIGRLTTARQAVPNQLDVRMPTVECDAIGAVTGFMVNPAGITWVPSVFGRNLQWQPVRGSGRPRG
jgi:hypothetical protein